MKKLGAQNTEGGIRDRIKEFRRVAADELLKNPKNWRVHPPEQVAALRGVLNEIGFAGAELCRELPDGSLMLIDGHSRQDLMGSRKIPCLITDLSEEEGDLLLATFDPIGAMATADSAKLDELLQGITVGDEAVSQMLAGLASESGLYGGNLDEVHWGNTDDKSVVPKSCVLNLLMFTADLDEIDDLLTKGAIDGERPVDTIKRGLHAIQK